MHRQKAPSSWPSQTNKPSSFSMNYLLHCSTKVMSLTTGLLTTPSSSICASYPSPRFSQLQTNLKTSHILSSWKQTNPWSLATKVQVGHCQAQQNTYTKIAEILQLKQKGMVHIPYSTLVPSTPCPPGPVCLRFTPCPSYLPPPSPQPLLCFPSSQVSGFWLSAAIRRPWLEERRSQNVSPLSFLLGLFSPYFSALDRALGWQYVFWLGFWPLPPPVKPVAWIKLPLF